MTTLEDFFKKAAPHWGTDFHKTPQVKVSAVTKDDHDDAGGWRVQVKGVICYGDTISEALDAALDCVAGRKSKRCRLNAPYFRGDPACKAIRVQYDYRKEDWKGKK